jgi:hypothetical protein
LSLLRDENFFSLNRSHGASKNPSFRTDLKNVRTGMTLVKSAPKESFSQKTILPIENFLQYRVLKKSVFGQRFFWVNFLPRSYVHF